MAGLLADDLHEHRTGDVIAGLGILDDEIPFILHHGGELRQRDISADPAMVKAALAVLLDGDRVLRLSHGGRRSVFRPRMRGSGPRPSYAYSSRPAKALCGQCGGGAAFGRWWHFYAWSPTSCLLRWVAGTCIEVPITLRTKAALQSGGSNNANPAALIVP